MICILQFSTQGLCVTLANVVNVQLQTMVQVNVRIEVVFRASPFGAAKVVVPHLSRVPRSASVFRIIPADSVLNVDTSMHVSSVEGQKVSKPAVGAESYSRSMEPVQVLRHDYWQKMLFKVYPAPKANDIFSKLKAGVRIGREPASKIIDSPNWPSSLEFAAQVSEAIANDLSNNRVLGPFSSPPYDAYIVSPLGAFLKRDGSKVRVIHDLSYPAHDSVNCLIDPVEFSLTYATVDDAVGMCNKFIKPPYLAKIDLKDAYKHVPVHPEDWHMLGIGWVNERAEKSYYFYKVLNFGLRSAPALFDIFAAALSDFVFVNGASPMTVRYVDDFLTISESAASCQASINVMLATCEEAGFQVQTSKVTRPSHVVQFLGIIIDVDKGELRISKERLEEIQQLLGRWLETRTCTKRQLLQLVGKLAFAARVVRTGRAFLGRLIDLSKKVTHLHHSVRLSTAARADIRWWASCVATHNGTSTMKEDWSAVEVRECFTDASNIGFGAYMDGEWFALTYSGRYVTLKEHSINWRELHVAVKALVTWARHNAGGYILFHIDNSAVCGMLNKLYTPATDLMEMVREWCLTVEKYNLHVCVVYISTHDNTIADALSRNQLEQADRLFPRPARQVWPSDVMYFGHVI